MTSNYGYRLTDDEVQERLTSLKANYTLDDQARLRAERDLWIDHRLGINVPPQVRESLQTALDVADSQAFAIALGRAFKKLATCLMGAPYTPPACSPYEQAVRKACRQILEPDHINMLLKHAAPKHHSHS